MNLSQFTSFLMPRFSLPYGRSTLTFTLPDIYEPEVVALSAVPGVSEPETAVRQALDNLLGGISWLDFTGGQTAAVAINDKTRPVPHQHLLPPLLQRLEHLGLAANKILLIIATGTHPEMKPGEFTAVLPQAIIDRYPVICHNADASDDLVHLGETSRGTPVWINRHFAHADFRLVVGNIEPHQFQGFSGGVKSAAIGLAGRATINHNHAMMTLPQAKLGSYRPNPARQDVEEIGQIIGIHLALNAILNDKKEIVEVVAGDPTAVIKTGIPLAKQICQAEVVAPFDLLIASPGGHPKDINIYQAQKGLAHARLITRDGGTLILAAACPEGTGSQGYEQWVKKARSHDEVLARFAREGFRIGPHKAFQISQDASRVKVHLVSDMAPGFVRQLLLHPVESLQEAVDMTIADLPASAHIGIMPRANVTIPTLTQNV